MARLSVTYDEELKEKVFMLRGDEDYARSTTTLLELGSPSIQLHDFNLAVTVNVLRDRGDGTIVIYDNDVIVGSIEDWTDQDNGRTISLNGLDYDIDHNIVAKYMGNNRCSPSSSKTETINVHDTYRAESILTLTPETQQFNPNESLTGTITLSNDHDTDYNYNQPITIIYDDTEISTPETVTDSEGQVSFEVEDVGELGLHQLLIQYGGSDNLTSAEYSLDISVGYKLDIVTSPTIMADLQPTLFEGKYADWFDNPIENATVCLQEVATQSVPAQSTTDENGVARIEVTSIGSGSFPEEVQLQFKVESSNTLSESFTTNIVNTDTITITSSTPRLYKNQQTVISIDTHNQYQDIPVGITIPDLNIYETIFTNSQGIATKTVVGNGVADKLITAFVGRGYEEVTLEDYELYWNKDTENVKIGDFSRSGYPYTIYELNKLFSIYTTNDDTAVLRVSSGGSWEMIMEGISTPTSTRLSFSSYYNNGESSYPIPLDKYDIRTYSNARIVLKSENGVISATVYEGETVIGTRSDISDNIASMVFRNFASNALQANFKKVSFRRL